MHTWHMLRLHSHRCKGMMSSERPPDSHAAAVVSCMSALAVSSSPDLLTH